jgi:hypothetical protein
MDLHGYLSSHMEDKHNVLSFTYTDLIEKVIKPAKAFKKDYDEVTALLKKIAPIELDFDLDSTVENMGAGQVKGRGFIVALAFLAAGGGDSLLGTFQTHGTQMVVITYGATGSTGVGFALAAERWLQRVGVTTVFKVALLAHQPSIAVERVVRPQTVMSVVQTMQLLPGSVLATGLPGILEDGKSRFWEDLLEFLPDLSANAANAEKKSKEEFADIDFDLSSNLLLLMLSYRMDLPERYLAYLLAHATKVSEADAVKVMKTYIASNWLTFGRPDAEGFSRVNLRSYKTLQLRYLRELLPALAYLSHSDIVVSGARNAHFFGLSLPWQQDYEIKLRGSNIVNIILEAAGYDTLVQLENSVRGQGATYAGMTEYEHLTLENSDEYTLEEVHDYFATPGMWHTEAWQLAAEAFAGEKHFEPGKHQPDDHNDYLWTQLVCSPTELVVRALSMMGKVEDPRILEQARKEREALAAGIKKRQMAASG